MQQDLLITDWTLRPSAYPSVTTHCSSSLSCRIRRCTPCVCVCVSTICGIPPTELNGATTARGPWRSRCHDATDDSEATRVGAIQAKRQARKTRSHHPEHWTVGMCSLRSCLRFPDQSVCSQTISSMRRSVVYDGSLIHGGLSVHDYIFGTTRPIFTKISVHVTYGRGSGHPLAA